MVPAIPKEWVVRKAVRQQHSPQKQNTAMQIPTHTPPRRRNGRLARRMNHVEETNHLEVKK